MEKELDLLRKNLKSDKLRFGEKECIKAVMAGKADKVFVASNAKDELKERLERYAKQGGFELILLNSTNSQLGAICKKQYNIAVATLVK